MNFRLIAFLLYQLYHQGKSSYFQLVKWYSNYLSICTITKPTIPKSTIKAGNGISGSIAVPPIFLTVPHLKAAPFVGLSGGGTVGMAKIAFFLFFIFVAICRANPSFWRARAAP
ncbi:hypothetical protein [Methylomonas sp. CM2]|uniref:hypothetical protein n=1 Tax=Methylomonas sp. CM2 TaxID=3417647 RepID=UPI003CE6AC40